MRDINKLMLAFFFSGVIANVQVEASNVPGPMFSNGTSGSSIAQSSSSGLDTRMFSNHNQYTPVYSLDYPEDFNRAMRDHVVFLFQQEGILDQNEMLTAQAIDTAEPFMTLEKLHNHNAKRDMNDISINGIWRKCKTRSIKADFCEHPIEIHFYKDLRTGKVYLRYDYKIKVDDYKPEATQKTEAKQAPMHKAKTAKNVVKKHVQIPNSAETVNTEMKQTPAPKAKQAKNVVKKQTLAHKPNTAHDAKKSPSPTVELTKLQLPDDITEIGEFSYQNIAEEAVTIRPSIKSIGYGSFVNCKNLKKVRIYKADIGPGVFFNCPSLKNIDIENGVKSIGNNSFSLKYEEVGGPGNCGPGVIRLPDSLVSIGNECFNNLNAVKQVILGANLTSIGYGFMAGNDHCRFIVKNGEGKERVKQLLINAGIPADRIND